MQNIWYTLVRRFQYLLYELTAARDGLSALTADVVPKNGIKTFSHRVLRLDIDTVSLIIITSSTTKDSDSKVIHSLFSLMQKEIHGLQNQQYK